MTQGTVFLVDDDPSVRKALQRLIRCAGYEVELLADAAAYLTGSAPRASPACLLLDIRMPGMSGFDLQSAIAGTDHALPIVFITGHGDEQVRAQAWRRAPSTCSSSRSTRPSSSAPSRAPWRGIRGYK